jgi:hypothetical protein
MSDAGNSDGTAVVVDVVEVLDSAVGFVGVAGVVVVGAIVDDAGIRVIDGVDPSFLAT